MPFNNITITVNNGLSFQANDFIQVVYDASTTIYGRVVSYNPSNGSLVFTP